MTSSNRKALIAAYKERPTIAGVFADATAIAHHIINRP